VWVCVCVRCVVSVCLFVSLSLPLSVRVCIYIYTLHTHTHTQTNTAMVPWDLKSNGVDHNNSILTVKCNTIMPHPTQPDKCIITTL
jgi:hypothetical protein